VNSVTPPTVSFKVDEMIILLPLRASSDTHGELTFNLEIVLQTYQDVSDRMLFPLVLKSTHISKLSKSEL